MLVIACSEQPGCPAFAARVRLDRRTPSLGTDSGYILECQWQFCKFQKSVALI